MKNEPQNTSVVGRDTALFHELTTIFDTNSMGLLTGRLPQGERSAHPKDAATASITAQLQATRQEYTDNRPGIAAHPAIRFDLQLSPGQSIADFLKEQLGEADATQLITDWALRMTLEGDVPLQNQAILFLDSNNKGRDKRYARRGDETSEEEDFKGAGLAGFANDIQATLICAVLIKKARDADIDLTRRSKEWGASAVAKLKPEELDLLIKLRDGVVRTSSGALAVGGVGRLRALYYVDGVDPAYWAVGAAPAAE